MTLSRYGNKRRCEQHKGPRVERFGQRLNNIPLHPTYSGNALNDDPLMVDEESPGNAAAAGWELTDAELAEIDSIVTRRG